MEISNRNSRAIKKNYKLVEKAYCIDWNKVEEGFLACSKICYADSIGKAKKILLEEIKYDGWKIKNSDDYITYLNIPIVRCAELDKHEFLIFQT